MSQDLQCIFCLWRKVATYGKGWLATIMQTHENDWKRLLAL